MVVDVEETSISLQHWLLQLLRRGSTFTHDAFADSTPNNTERFQPLQTMHRLPSYIFWYPTNGFDNAQRLFAPNAHPNRIIHHAIHGLPIVLCRGQNVPHGR